MKTLSIRTDKKKQIVDITDILEHELSQNGGGEGLCHLHVLHTTAAITTADLDPGTDLDMLDAFEAIIPDLNYRHPHDPTHVGDHIMSSLIGPSILIPFQESTLTLGTWQRVVLVEFDGPRERSIVLSILREQ